MTTHHDQKAHDPKPQPHDVIIHVNETSVTIPGPKASGADIKRAAIAQGVQLDMDFILQEEVNNGSTQQIGDEDVITINKNSRFLAIAPDDNS
ncbi:hypothetical protein HLB42_21405 (plasmid) [Deinococcus sp. D7000]|nr:hypothetical protein HLB42_21405 [Deinococcus sp. D7000]